MKMNKLVEIVKTLWGRVKVALKPAAKAGIKAAAKVIKGSLKPTAALLLLALVLMGCSTQMPQPKGAGISVVNVGLPVVMWFTSDQDAPSVNEESNAAVQANPVTPTVDFPAVK